MMQEWFNTTANSKIAILQTVIVAAETIVYTFVLSFWFFHAKLSEDF